MRVITQRLLREYRARMLTVSLAMTTWFLVILLVARDMAGQVEAKADLFGGALTKGFGLGSLATPDAVIAQLVAVSFNHPIVLALIGAMTVSLGTRACQGELADGTLDVTLARAISRTRYLTAYVVVIALAVLVLMVIAGGSTLLFDSIFGVPGMLDPGRVFWMCVNGAAVYLAFGALALLMSVLSARHGNAGFLTIGILVVMYAISFVERVWSGSLMDVLGPLSLFHWFDPAAILTGFDIEARNILVPLAAAVVGTALAIWRFERRDL